MLCARPFRAEDLTAPADVGDEHGRGLITLEVDHQMVFAVGPHDRAGILVIRSDLPPHPGEHPPYILPALSRTRHTFLPYFPSERLTTPRLQVRLASLQLLHQVLLF